MPRFSFHPHPETYTPAYQAEFHRLVMALDDASKADPVDDAYRSVRVQRAEFKSHIVRLHDICERGLVYGLPQLRTAHETIASARVYVTGPYRSLLQVGVFPDKVLGILFHTGYLGFEKAALDAIDRILPQPAGAGCTAA